MAKDNELYIGQTVKILSEKELRARGLNTRLATIWAKRLDGIPFYIANRFGDYEYRYELSFLDGHRLSGHSFKAEWLDVIYNFIDD